MDLNALNNVLDQLDIDKDLGDLEDEGMEEQGEAIWNHYREYGPADLQAIMRDLDRRIQDTRRCIQDLVREGAEAAEAAEVTKKNLRVLLARLDVAKRQLHLRVVNLQKPSKHGDMSSDIPLWMRDELGEDTVRTKVRDQHLWAEFRQRKDEAESVADLRKELAEKYDVAEGTVRRVVYDD